MLFYFLLFPLILYVHARDRWTEDQANTWYKNVPWITGSQYITSDAGNQLEMFQADTFNPELIDKELGWAEDLGLKSMRIFLHDLAYSQDVDGFKSRLDTVLGLCAKHGIRPMIVFFDSCWNSFPVAGKQPQPIAGVMLSAWSQSPGAKSLLNTSDWTRLETYIKDIVGTFANDSRVLIWDLWNEPDNMNGGVSQGEPANKTAIVDLLLPSVFDWARSANPTQPLTSALTDIGSNFASSGKLTLTQSIQINNSDVLTFHHYASASDFVSHVVALQKYNRPIICSEFMARPRGSYFITHYPVAKSYNVGMYNWAFVNGKTECNYPWDSWHNNYIDDPPTQWFHEIFRKDGTPYLAEETNVIKRYNGCPKGHQSITSNSTCYYGYTNVLSWTDAFDACRKDGAYLVTISSAFDNTDLTNFLTSNYSSCNSFSIGLYSHYDEWIWSNYFNVAYTNWKSGYPISDPSSKCVVLNKDGTWTNQPCSNTQCYVCSF